MIILQKEDLYMANNIFGQVKPCEKCNKMCKAENTDFKKRMFEQVGDLYRLDGKLLCFGCFFKTKTRGR